jgi:hypothetical protein
VSTEPRDIDRGRRIVAGFAVRVTELIWPDAHRSYQVHLIDGDVDLTASGCLDDPPTDTQISDLLANHCAVTGCEGAGSADLVRELITMASARLGWQVDLVQLPITCAHTPHLVIDVIDAGAAYLAALATRAALTDAARSIQTVITAAGPGAVDWFSIGLLGNVAHLATSRDPQLGHTRRALIAALRALQEEDAAWPPDPISPDPTPTGATQPAPGPDVEAGPAEPRQNPTT